MPEQKSDRENGVDGVSGEQEPGGITSFRQVVLDVEVLKKHLAAVLKKETDTVTQVFSVKQGYFVALVPENMQTYHNFYHSQKSECKDKVDNPLVAINVLVDNFAHLQSISHQEVHVNIKHVKQCCEDGQKIHV